MSAQRLSARSIRRVERQVGEPVLLAWSHGGYTFNFVTPDHRHGSVNKISGDVQWHENPMHYTSCWDELFPGQRPNTASPQPASSGHDQA